MSGLVEDHSVSPFQCSIGSILRIVCASRAGSIRMAPMCLNYDASLPPPGHSICRSLRPSVRQDRGLANRTTDTQASTRVALTERSCFMALYTAKHGDHTRPAAQTNTCQPSTQRSRRLVRHTPMTPSFDFFIRCSTHVAKRCPSTVDEEPLFVMVMVQRYPAHFFGWV